MNGRCHLYFMDIYGNISNEITGVEIDIEDVGEINKLIQLRGKFVLTPIVISNGDREITKLIRRSKKIDDIRRAAEKLDEQLSKNEELHKKRPIKGETRKRFFDMIMKRRNT